METKDRKLRRWMWIGLSLLLLAWLVPAAFVAIYDPRVQHETSALEATIDDVLPGSGAKNPWFRPHGYAKSWAIETCEVTDGYEATADKHRAEYRVERGPLDRAAGTFAFAVRCTLNHAEDVEGMRLYVTSVSPWPDRDDASWRMVAEASVLEPGAASVTLVCSGEVPASSTAYQTEEVRGGSVRGGFTKSMLTAPTALGRAYDAIAWWPAFRWLPTLR